MTIQYSSYSTPRADLGEAIREYDPSIDGFVATEVLPVLPVQKEAANIAVITRESTKRVDPKHANGSAYNRVTFNTEDLAYACVNYGLEEQLTNRDREKYSSDFDAELETVEFVRHRLFMEREIRVKDLIFNTTTWTGADLYTDVSAAPWDAAASDAVGHVLAAKGKVRANTGMDPDSILIGAVALNNLLGNTDIKARFPAAAVLSEEMIRTNLANIFGLQNLFVGRKAYDSTKEGQAASMSDVWADDYAMIFKLQTGSTRSGGLGRILAWEDMEQIMAVLTYREEQTNSDIFRVEEYVDELVFDKYFGHLLKVDA